MHTLEFDFLFRFLQDFNFINGSGCAANNCYCSHNVSFQRCCFLKRQTSQQQFQEKAASSPASAIRTSRIITLRLVKKTKRQTTTSTSMLINSSFTACYWTFLPSVECGAFPIGLASHDSPITVQLPAWLFRWSLSTRRGDSRAFCFAFLCDRRYLEGLSSGCFLITDFCRNGGFCFSQ